MFTRKKKRNDESVAQQQPDMLENELNQTEETSEETSDEPEAESEAKPGEKPSEESDSSDATDEADDAEVTDDADVSDVVKEEELLKALDEMAPDVFAYGEKEAVASLALRILEEGKDGAFSRETLEMLHGAVALERMVAEADKEGEIRGRNAQIEEQMEIESSGDGLPHLSSISGASPRRVASIFDLAREA